MSDSDVKTEFKNHIDQDLELDRKRKEIQVDRVNSQYERLTEAKQRLQAAQQGNYGTISDEEAAELSKENADYMEAAGKPMVFINDAFKGVIPFFAKNMILCGAKTGEGKTTAVANIVRQVIAHINPATGRPGRVLILTNEENKTDLYNRITCLAKGWHYVNHDQFTPEQREEMAKMIPILRHRVTIIDDDHVKGGGSTTTPEGIEEIFKNLIRTGEYYDAVVIDYYQGVIESSKDLHMDEYKCQRKLTHVLEKYRKIYPAPIVVMAQINPPEDKDSPSPFQVRIQGTKLICNKATSIVEIIAHRDRSVTEWYMHKGRYASSVGESIVTGYQNGKYVRYTEEFQQEIQRMREIRANAEFNKEISIKLEKKEPVNG